MENLASAMAAFSAGKLPTTKQANAGLDWLLQSNLIQLEQKADETGGELSENGKVLIKDLRSIVEAYKKIGEEKNADNKLQDALYNLSQGDVTAGEGEEENEAQKDAKAFAAALKGLVTSVLTHMGSEGGDLLADFASFSRGSLADVAEVMESGARAAKEKLREVEDEVQEGKRDAIGLKKETDEEKDMDARETFEKRMDTIKEVGSQAIGVAQDTSEKVKEVSGKASDRIDDSLWRICDRAQKDKEYHDHIETLFAIGDKWVSRTVDKASEASTADEESSSTDMESQIAELIQDPTGRIPSALRSLRVVAERFAGGKSLETLYAAAAQCAADVREDKEVKSVFEDWEAYARKCLDEPGYLRSDECVRTRDELSERWKTVMDADTDAGRKWKGDTEKFWQEWDDFGTALKEDGSLNQLKEAHQALGKDLGNAGMAVAQSAIGQSQWVWQDVLNVFLPRAFELMKSIPLPRTEYVDDKVEFVFENVDLTSLHLLPGHAHISSTTDIHVDAPTGTKASTDVSTRTRVHLTGVQLALKDLSFWFQDKTSSFLIGPVTGLVDMTVPPRGVDVDMTLGLLPTLSGAEEREKREAFHKVEDVTVQLHDIELNIKNSNRPILLSVFQPILRAGLVAALKSALQENIRTFLEQLDHTAFDVHRRAGVFADAGVPTSASYIGGLISEIGNYNKKNADKPSLMEGVTTTSVGIIKDIPGQSGKVAIGAGPQILSGDKHGPIAPFHEGPGVDVESGKAQAAQVAGAAKDTAAKAQKKLASFKETVEEKREKELKSEGWQTDAFDLPA